MQPLAPALLAGDIGGTKTALAIFTIEGGPRQPLMEKTFPSAGLSQSRNDCTDLFSRDRSNDQPRRLWRRRAGRQRQRECHQSALAHERNDLSHGAGATGSLPAQ